MDYNAVSEIDGKPGRVLGRSGRRPGLDKTWDKVLDDSDARFTSGLPVARSIPVTTPWTGTAKQGRAGQAALIYDSPVTGQVKTYSYDELRDEVAVLPVRCRLWRG